MAQQYPTADKADFPLIEHKILDKWRREDSFRQGLARAKHKPRFVFYEGPPGANGQPGIHHVISRAIKDLFCRYKSQKGFYVERNAGWDTHGLPVELHVEQSLGIKKEDIGKTVSVREYNQRCYQDVFKYKHDWEELSEKMGYWLDMDNPYITCETKYIESLWWVIKQLYDKNLLYRSWSIQPYSPAAGTGLSSHELNQPGAYKTVKDTTVTAMFRVLEQPQQTRAHPWLERIALLTAQMPYLLAWTTTPWTLPSNLGLAVGETIQYVLVETYNPYVTAEPQRIFVVLAKDLCSRYFPPFDGHEDLSRFTPGQKQLPFRVLCSFEGKELAGLRYERLLAGPDVDADPFRVICADFVTTQDGTGIVHVAPAFGVDDYKVGQKHHLGMLIGVDETGKLIEGIEHFSGRYVKNYTDDPHYEDTNVDICVYLKKQKRAFRIEKYEHSYPHCWRTGKPILYYPVQAWFVRVSAKIDRLVELNRHIAWKPESTGAGRFGKWLENAQDWNLSRSRFWGTPLPIWQTADAKHQICIGSLDQLRRELHKARALNSEQVWQKVHAQDVDLHKPLVDEIVLVSPDNEPMYREPSVVDVWFDSGAMPYAQWHYPFDNQDTFANCFPADFICEGVDQTRGWFYTLHVLSVLLFDSVAFRSVIANGLVLDKNGDKMSKRLGNTVNPYEVIATYGADALRWYLITNSSPWDNLRFQVDGIREVQRKFFGTLYNTYQFFALYANLDQFVNDQPAVPVCERPQIDRWILSTLHSTIQKITALLDEYDATTAMRILESFCVDDLSNWYVRLSRRRFWRQKNDADKHSAYQTLHECLLAVAQLIAPTSPFFAEWLYGNLAAVCPQSFLQSVHHSDFPQADTQKIDDALQRRMRYAQDICSAVLSVRKLRDIKVRQPLRRILLPCSEQQREDVEPLSSLILQETNVKTLEFVSIDSAMIAKTIQPNFAVLGKKIGGKMKALGPMLAEWSQEQIRQLEQTGHCEMTIEGETMAFGLADFHIRTKDVQGWAIGQKGTVTLALDLQLTPALIEEGNVRELVNKIQHLRKESNFSLDDTIRLTIQCSSPLQESFQTYQTYICAELLCEKLEFANVQGHCVNVNGQKVYVQVQQLTQA